MEALHKGIVTLLKSAVSGEALTLPEGFDIEQALPLIQKHHIVTAAYEGAVKCGVPRDLPVMQTLFKKYYSLLLKSEHQLRAIDELFRAFDENQIDYMPLKGSKLKSLYPKPELRYMGDADVLIRMEQYEKIEPLMRSLGYESVLESDNELVWDSKALHVELHKGLIPPEHEDFYSYLGNGWQMAQFKNGTRYAMSSEDEMVFLFAHFAKHYRVGGVGCRYVADLWLYRKHHPELNDEYVISKLKEMYLDQFYKNVLRTIDVWFNDLPADEVTEIITAFVFASGSWGDIDSFVLSSAVKNSKHVPEGVSNRFVYFWRTLFPSLSTLRKQYTVLQKHPWLLPIIWVVRLFRKFFFEPKAVRRQKRNLKLINEKNIADRQQMLNAVGLDFNF